MPQLVVEPQISVEMLCGKSPHRASLNANIVTVLVEVDKLGSLNAATKRLHMSYSNTLYSICAVEKALGTTIMERRCPEGSRLTDAGHALVALFEIVQTQTRQYAGTVVDEALSRPTMTA